ncbi:hypothetical protein PVK06_030377 [Gossypium arboreum]|uniref:Retroviral polymerase SH3-like domain-containing protein n=1 Tax=Gossypium arboreum TaxID=29729 RepID=A0ABR0NN46_GOSAR|nr:hypothetical protein PVK06_030377 [Gossypium arboreum]
MSNLGYFKVWGCLVYYRVLDQQRTKLGPRAVKGAFVGYAQHSKAYRVLDLVSNTIIETRDVVLIENKIFNNSKNSEKEYQPMISSDQTKRSLYDNKDTELTKSQRVRKVKDFGPDFISSQSLAFLVEGNREFIIMKIPIMFNVNGDPQSYGEAMTSRDVAFWKKAISDEMDSILSNNTWILVDFSQGSNPIRCKLVFKRKNTPTGFSPTFMARLVVEGFKKKERHRLF